MCDLGADFALAHLEISIDNKDHFESEGVVFEFRKRSFQQVCFSEDVRSITTDTLFTVEQYEFDCFLFVEGVP